MSQFKMSEFNDQKLYLENCEYDGAYIEIGLKGSENTKKNTPSNLNSSTVNPLS